MAERGDSYKYGENSESDAGSLGDCGKCLKPILAHMVGYHRNDLFALVAEGGCGRRGGFLYRPYLR